MVALAAAIFCCSDPMSRPSISSLNGYFSHLFPKKTKNIPKSFAD